MGFSGSPDALSTGHANNLRAGSDGMARNGEERLSGGRSTLGR